MRLLSHFSASDRSKFVFIKLWRMFPVQFFCCFFRVMIKKNRYLINVSDPKIIAVGYMIYRLG
jgi:hypothetical protein